MKTTFQLRRPDTIILDINNDNTVKVTTNWLENMAEFSIDPNRKDLDKVYLDDFTVRVLVDTKPHMDSRRYSLFSVSSQILSILQTPSQMLLSIDKDLIKRSLLRICSKHEKYVLPDFDKTNIHYYLNNKDKLLTIHVNCESIPTN